jgi:pimeloyl-ACP methyl ester carboxylesterase
MSPGFRMPRSAAGALLAAAMLLLAAAGAARAQPPALATESYTIPATDDPAIHLYVRNKHPAGMTHFTGDKILLFVHGATYPAETAFDLPLNGLSMMDFIAQHGWDVWLVDVRGYGGSTRPPAMDAPPAANPPFADTPTAARDVGAAVDHILQKRGVARINLMGWSWGTAIMGLYTTTHNDKVNRLVLYAPLWIFNSRPKIGGDGPLGAYRAVTQEQAHKRWIMGVAPDQVASLIPPGWFEQWAKATWATDPAGGGKTLRAPNGVIADVRAYWAAGKAQYNPEDIRVPTLLIHAEWDADLPSYQAQGYFAHLTHAPYKRFVELGQGTHTVMMEKNRMQFFHEVMNFLDEPDPQALN